MATTNSWTPETLAEMLSMGGEHINSYTPPTLEGMELSGPYPTPDPEAVRYRRWRFPCYTVLVHGTEQDVNQILPDSWSLHARIDYQYSRGGRRIYLWDSVPRVKFLADGEQLPPLWPSKSESIFYRRFPDQPCQEWRKSFSLPLAISDDNSLTFTPQSLDVMMGRPDASSPQDCPLLKIPKEIRDIIYAYVAPALANHTTIDFASCVDCEHEYTQYLSEKDFDNDPNQPAQSRLWYASEWRKIRISPIFGICHQLQDEVSEAVFARPLKFTGDLGWTILYRFLLRIGPRNRRLLKEITICHPGFSVAPEDCPLRRQNRDEFPNDRDENYTALFNDHMRAFMLGRCLPQSYRQVSTNQDWLALEQFDGPLRLLSEAVNLEKLTLTLPQFQRPIEQSSFADLGQHPIHTFQFPQGPQLQRSVANLIHARHDCVSSIDSRNAHQMQLCLDQVFGRPSRLFEDDAVPNADRLPQSQRSPTFYADNPHNSHPPERAFDARKFFEAVAKEGWSVREYMYDERGTYPVGPRRLCVNEDMCRTLAYCDDPEIWSACPGNLDEVEQHRKQ